MSQHLPNVVLIHWHDLGRYLGCYGRPVCSPAADRLASEGMRFTRAFCTSPICSPSRGSLFTGRYPHTNGLMGLAHRGWELNHAEDTLQSRLGEAGYRTQLFGFQHERAHARELGFDEVFQPAGTPFGHELIQPFTDFLRQEQKPFFASVGFFECHRVGPQQNYPEDLYPPTEVKSTDLPEAWPDDPLVRREFGAFASCVEEADRSLGQLLEAIEAAGQANNTLVVFTTDHGIAFPRSKATLFDAGLEVALIMKWPGKIKPGTSTSALTSLLDVTPTLLDLVGLPPLPEAQGKSQAPVVWQQEDSVQEEIFAEHNFDVRYRPMRCVRTPKYKLIRHYKSQPDWQATPDVEESTTNLLLKKTQNKQSRSLSELYDLESDPQETCNLIETAQHQSVRRLLEHQLESWMKTTKDPLLLGPVPIPPHCRDRYETINHDNP